MCICRMNSHSEISDFVGRLLKKKKSVRPQCVQPTCTGHYGTSPLACIAVAPLFLSFSVTKNLGFTSSGLHLITDYLAGNLQEHCTQSSNSIKSHQYDGYSTITYNNKYVSKSNNPKLHGRFTMEINPCSSVAMEFYPDHLNVKRQKFSINERKAIQI